MTMVCILFVGHRHGHDFWACRNEDVAKEVLADYCREWWNDHVLLKDKPTPDDNDTVIEQYFAANEDEDYEIHLRGVIG